MKLLKKILLVAAFCFLVAGAAVGKPSDAYASSLRFTTTAVNMRTGPGTNYSIITCVPAGYQVQYMGTSGSWTKVYYNKREGYISSQYLSTKTNSYAQYVDTTSLCLKGDNVNMRTGAGTNYSVIRSFRSGSMFTYQGSSGNWYKVKSWDTGLVGWMCKSYF